MKDWRRKQKYMMAKKVDQNTQNVVEMTVRLLLEMESYFMFSL